MQSLLDILRKTAEFFAKHGVPQPRLNADLLLAHVLGVQRMQLYLQFEKPLDDATLDRLRPLVRRRAKREPLQHLIGSVEFGELQLTCDARALIPRPETEYLIDLLARRFAEPAPGSILDLGTGSGAIALELARRFPQARVVATDASESALALARENAARNQLAHRVEFRLGSWFSSLETGERFSWIVSNPPYLSEEEWKACEPEVRDHDPKPALVSGGNGSADARHILAGARAHLEPAGLLALEVGETHPPLLAQEAPACGFASAEPQEDLAGRPRFLIARMPGVA